MSEYQTGQIVTVTGSIQRAVTPDENKDRTGKWFVYQVDSIWLGKPADKQRYAYWVKETGFPYKDSVKAIVLGYSWKKAGVQVAAREEGCGEFCNDVAGYLDEEYSGMAWVVMPLGQTNRYRKPITTIVEFMSIAEPSGYTEELRELRREVRS